MTLLHLKYTNKSILKFSSILSFFLSSCLRSMAYGTEYGLVVVDIVQKISLLNIASPDLYGAQDPYARTPRSPKRTETGASRDEQARSPSIDQVCTIVQSFSLFLFVSIYLIRFIQQEMEAIWLFKS